MEKKRFRCKMCRSRSWFRPEVRRQVVGGHTKVFFWVKCPKCLSEGAMRYRK